MLVSIGVSSWLIVLVGVLMFSLLILIFWIGCVVLIFFRNVWVVFVFLLM